MGQPTDLKTAAKTWQSMVDSNQALLLRKSSHDVAWWVERARAAGLKNDAELRGWMRDEHGITGYSQYAVSWGYPEFMLRDADELIDAQYASHPELRPIADAFLAWAAETEGVEIQLRKGYVSLHTPRRKRQFPKSSARNVRSRLHNSGCWARVPKWGTLLEPSFGWPPRGPTPQGDR